MSERPVVVTTQFRGIFFGYAEDTSGDTIKLRHARNALYWDAACRGFVGLAVVGPIGASRVGPAANMEVRKVTAVLEVTPEAVAVWESGPWPSETQTSI